MTYPRHFHQALTGNPEGLPPQHVHGRSVTEDASLEDVVAKMEEHQIRRVPVVDASGCCCGIISQADVAMVAQESEVGEMVREVSRDVVAN